MEETQDRGPEDGTPDEIAALSGGSKYGEDLVRVHRKPLRPDRRSRGSRGQGVPGGDVITSTYSPPIEELPDCFGLRRYRYRGVVYKEAVLLPEVRERLQALLAEAALLMGVDDFVQKTSGLLKPDDSSKFWRESRREAATFARKPEREDFRPWPARSTSLVRIRKDEVFSD